MLLNEAEPPLSVAEPICVDTSRKLIEPVGMPFPDCGATAAVNVTLCPPVSCVAEAESEVAVAIFVGAEIATDTALDVEGEKFVSPE